MKKAVCILEDRGRSSAIRWEDEACSIIAFCLIMYVSTYFSLVGHLAHNATRLSLSNEPFLLIESCVFFVFMMCLHANNTLSTLYTHKTTAPRIVWCFPFFSLPKKQA